jgi:succinate-acetate transporter protein
MLPESDRICEEDHMTSIDHHLEPMAAQPAAGKAPPAAEAATWGNSAPLALAAFGVTTFMLSMINANLVNIGTLPVVFAVAFMFGGLTQLVAGIIQLRTGNVFGGVLFTGFGAFWLSLWAIGDTFLKAVPLLQVGHALGLFLYAFGIFAFMMFVASFRTSIVTVVALAGLTAALFVLGAGNYTASSGLIKTGGWIGIVVAGLALYLSLTEVCEATYGREILPVGHLAKPAGESLGE